MGRIKERTRQKDDVRPMLRANPENLAVQAAPRSQLAPPRRPIDGVTDDCGPDATIASMDRSTWAPSTYFTPRLWLGNSMTYAAANFKEYGTAIINNVLC